VLAACGAIKLNEMLSLKPCDGTPPQWRLFRDGDQMRIDTRSGTPTLMLTIQSAAEQPVANVIRQCPKWDGKPLTLDVSNTFPEGSVVRDFYSKQTATVRTEKSPCSPPPTVTACCCLSAPKPTSRRRLAGKTPPSISC
jgi:alpha-amylase